MASLKEYKNFDDEIMKYVKLRIGSSENFHRAFSKNGALAHVIKVLDSQKQEIQAYEEKLVAEFDPELDFSIRDNTNKQLKINAKQLQKIEFLQERLKDLERVATKSKSDWTIRKAMSEFLLSVEAGEKKELGLFATIRKYTSSLFSLPPGKALSISKKNLVDMANNLLNSKVDRVNIQDFPSKNQQNLNQNLSNQINQEQNKGTKNTIPQPPPLPPLNITPKQVVNNAKNSPPPPPPTKNTPIKQKEGAARQDLLSSIRNAKDDKSNNLSNNQLKNQQTPAQNLSEKVSQEQNKGTKNTIPQPPSPPPLNITPKQVVNNAKNSPPPPPPTKNTPIEQKEGATKQDLLSSIRNAKDDKRKSNFSKDHANASGQIDYKYIDTSLKPKEASGIMASISAQIGSSDKNPNYILNDKDKETQLNILYSAIYDNNATLVKAFQEHKTQVDTGRKDEWDEPIKEMKSTFTADDINKAQKAVEETRVRIKNGVDLPGNKAEEVVVENVVSSNEQKQGEVNLPGGTEQNVSLEKQTENNIKTDLASGVNTVENKTPPPPPPPQPPKLGAPRAIRGGPLLKEIQAGANLKAVTPKSNFSFNVDGFVYTGKEHKIKSHEENSEQNLLRSSLVGRRKSVEGTTFNEKKFKKMSNQEQLNELYSSIIDDNQNAIGSINEVGDSKIFNKETILKICGAASKVADEMRDAAKKVRIKKAVKNTLKEFGVSLTQEQASEKTR